MYLSTFKNVHNYSIKADFNFHYIHFIYCLRLLFFRSEFK